MTVKLLLDNWTLQNAGEFLHGQRAAESADELDINASGGQPTYQPMSQDVVALTSLLQVLQHIVLAEEMVTDAAFAESWSGLPAIAKLHAHGFLKTRDFKSAEAHWSGRREMLADELSSCAAGIRQQHEENKRAYEREGKSVDVMLSQVLWGTAGMLARAELTRLPYLAHPLRARLLTHSRFLGARPSAHGQLQQFVEAERLKLFRRAGVDSVYGTLQLPAPAVEAFTRCTTLSDLIPAAIELHRQYAELRDWLGKLQAALDAEDINEILSRRKVFQHVSENITRLTGAEGGVIASVQVTFGVLPNLTINPRALTAAVHSRGSVHVQVHRLSNAAAGEKSFRHLLRLMGEGNTARGLRSNETVARFRNPSANWAQ